MGQNSAKPITVYNDSENLIGDTFEEAEAVDELHLLQKELDNLDTSFEIMKQELVCPLCECIIKMGKFTRKCPLCKTHFHNENIFHSAIVENLVYAYRRCIKSFQEIENHRIFIKKLESVQSSSSNELNRYNSSNSNNSRYRSRLDSDQHSLPISNSTNNNIPFPRSLSSQYRLPQLNEFFLPDEPPKTPHELPHIESPHFSLLNSNNTSNCNSNIATPSMTPTGDTIMPSFLDSNNNSNNNLKSSHSHLLKPIDKTLNFTPPSSSENSSSNPNSNSNSNSNTNNNNNVIKCRSRGYSDTTNTSFFTPPSINFHSDKGNKLIDNSTTSFTLTPVEIVSTPTTDNSSGTNTPSNHNTTINDTTNNNNNHTSIKRSTLNPYSTPPLSPEKPKPKPATAVNGSLSLSPEYTARKLADDDKEDNYIVMSSSPAVNRNKRSIALDSAIIGSNDNCSTPPPHSPPSHLIIGSPLCSPSRKKPEMKAINSIVLDQDDENATVVTSVDSLLDGMPNSSDSMICHNGDS